MEKQEKKNVPVELGDEILKKVSAGLTAEELLRIFESGEARYNELLGLRNENMRSQMDAAQEAYEASRAAGEKDFAAGLSFSLPGIE